MTQYLIKGDKPMNQKQKRTFIIVAVVLVLALLAVGIWLAVRSGGFILASLIGKELAALTAVVGIVAVLGTSCFLCFNQDW